jgi:hypothetical protein
MPVSASVRIGYAAGMIEQILAVATGPMSGVQQAEQNKEARVRFIAARSRNNNGGAAQLFAVLRESLGDKIERVHTRQFKPADAPDGVRRSLEHKTLVRPFLSDPVGPAFEGVANAGAQAIDVNMSLILAAAGGRVDGKPDAVAGQGLSELGEHELPRVPGCPEKWRCFRTFELLAFDVRDAHSRYRQKLGFSSAVFQDRDARAAGRGQVDPDAGRRVADRKPVRNASVM